ncbi:MAG TPA: hypothetical protein VIL00_01790 [Pseudonocardiaceae bacterium]
MSLPALFSRRRLLRATVSIAAATAAAPVVTACSNPEPPPGPDPLEALVERARADAALARAVAEAHPTLAPQAVAAVVADRTAHAETLAQEVYRARPDLSTPPSASSTPTAAPTVPPNATAALAALQEALTTAQDQAAALVPTLPTYRAGLVGSVAASCSALREVLG